MDTLDTIKILGSLLGSGSLSKGSGGNVLGNLLGAALGGAQNQQTQGGGALGDVLGGLLGGGGQSGSGGAMADMLGGILGGGKQQGSGGGLGDMLGGMLGSATGSNSSGGASDILGSLLGGSSKSSSGLAGAAGMGGMGGLLGAAVAKYAQNENDDLPDPKFDDDSFLPQGMAHKEAVDEATLMIRAMVNAAKSDGNLDKEEQDKIIGKLGKVSQDEVNFLKHEFAAPLDVQAFVSSIPDGLQQQIYAVSLMAIDLDTNHEAKYLHELAQGLGIEPKMANQLHEQLGAPKIYS